MYTREISSSKDGTIPQRRRTPSFSSSLLDAIYRSIDEPNNGGEEEVLRATAMIKKQSAHSVSTVRRDLFVEEERETSNLNRAVLIERWMEKQSVRGCSVHSYSTSSSDSSSRGGSHGGLFSSSDDAEPVVKQSSRNKPVADHNKHQKPKCENGFAKTKLKAKKIYGELKKVKQPISPGGRIATFLNSIFSSGSAKKVKICSVGAMDDVSTERKSKSACSSVSSFSRSCLSKTPPSRQNQSNGKKRSVRFYPVSVIVDEDSKPCGHKCIYEDDPGLMPMAVPQKIAKSSSLKEEVARGAKYIRNYQRKKMSEFDFRGFHSYIEEDEESDEEDDESCSSSDLFELDHLIGIGRYREELPVYETTNLKTNQAIANGFIV